MKKSFYKIEFKLASPLALSSGQGLSTDKDIMVDSKGRPFIPGTSLAGVYRAHCDDNKETNAYFGYVDVSGKADTIIESNIKVYDATIKESDLKDDVFYISNRDCVALDEWKTAKKGSKFDFEVAEPETVMITYIEVSDGNEEITNRILGLWESAEYAFGAKTSRGYGKIKDVEIYKIEFDLTKDRDVYRYTDFDMYGDKEWDAITNIVSEPQCNMAKVVLSLQLKGGISIRRYSTDANQDGTSAPDYSQLTYHNGTPTIPGTSWAGAFKHRIEEFTSEDISNKYFGEVNDKKKRKTKSQIVFSETPISGGSDVIMTRNAIDRFTGGTVDGALYTEKTHYGGTTELTIQYPKTADETFVKAIAAAICDLSYGFMAVGGLTSIGRGIFEVTDYKVTDDNIMKVFLDDLINKENDLRQEVKA